MSMTLHFEHHHRAVEHLLHSWAHAIDDNRVEEIATLMAPDGRYTVQSRFNADRGLPHCLIDAHSAAQLRDRILSMRQANIYEPHHYRHVLSAIQVTGGDGTLLQVRSSFLVVRTMDLDGDMRVFACGRCDNVVDVSGPQPVFRARRFLLDSRVVETLLVIPL